MNCCDERITGGRSGRGAGLRPGSRLMRGACTALCVLCSSLFFFSCAGPDGRGKATAPVPFTAQDPFLRASTPVPAESRTSPAQNDLATVCIPTDIARFGETWFIVDCYHDRVIFHDNLTDPLTEWKRLPGEMKHPHTIASDGTVYLIDDTDNNRVLVYEKEGADFFLTQYFEEIGDHPHDIVYDAVSETFYVWSSMNGEMYLFRRDAAAGGLYLTEVKTVDALKNTYVRSFSFDHEARTLTFVSGVPAPGADASAFTPEIVICDADSFEIKERISVPEEIAGMAQIVPLPVGFLITVSTDRHGDQSVSDILFAESLQDLTEGRFTRLYRDHFPGDGTPYRFREIDGTLYLCDHRPGDGSIWRLTFAGGAPGDITLVY